MKKITLVTDGSCLGNPGPGGWAAVIRYGKYTKKLSGSAPQTTNNRMEIAAVIEGLNALKEPCDVTIVTDSQYVKTGMTLWLDSWKGRNWKTKSKTTVKNKEIWLALEAATSRHKVSWKWVKGHATHADNNLCDVLAKEAAANQAVVKES